MPFPRRQWLPFQDGAQYAAELSGSSPAEAARWLYSAILDGVVAARGLVTRRFYGDPFQRIETVIPERVTARSPSTLTGDIGPYNQVEVFRDDVHQALHAAARPAPADQPAICAEAVDGEPSSKGSSEVRVRETFGGDAFKHRPASERQGRERDPVEDLRLRNRIETVLLRARNKWPDPANRPSSLRRMAEKLCEEKGTIEGFQAETVRKILTGEYRPMERLGIAGLDG